jgi:hypothetical protein
MPLFETGLFEALERDNFNPNLFDEMYQGLVATVLVSTLVKTIEIRHLP